MRPGLSRPAWLLVGLLALGVAGELAWPSVGSPAIPPAPIAGTPGQAAPIEAVAAWAQASIERPVFTPGRRPDMPGAAPIAAPGGRPEPPRLTGIMLGAGGGRAIFAPPAANAAATVVGEGGSVGPWRVEVIRAGEVQLAGPDGRRTVRPAYSDAANSASIQTGGQLPQLFPADRTPLNSLPQSPGATMFRNSPAAAAARTP